MTELLGLPFSPWSEKARWALEVRHVPYKSRLYAPLIGEPSLRWKLGKWTGKVTVPVLTRATAPRQGCFADPAMWPARSGSTQLSPTAAVFDVRPELCVIGPVSHPLPNAGCGPSSGVTLCRGRCRETGGIYGKCA